MNKRDAKVFYKEPDDMLKPHKDYKRVVENAPDMNKVKKYYSQKKVK